MGFPAAVALECLRHNRARKPAELLAASRLELRRRFAKALPVKAVSDAVPCAFAHDRQAFPNGEPWGARGRSPQTRITGKRLPAGNVGGKGAKPPKPKRWRCGGRGERAGARGLPQRHRSSSREAARSSARITAPARTWGFPKGGVQHPTLVRGFARG